MQKGYYYDLISKVWTEGPVIAERARYCPTCVLGKYFWLNQPLFDLSNINGKNFGSCYLSDQMVK